LIADWQRSPTVLIAHFLICDCAPEVLALILSSWIVDGKSSLRWCLRAGVPAEAGLGRPMLEFLGCDGRLTLRGIQFTRRCGFGAGSSRFGGRNLIARLSVRC